MSELHNPLFDDEREFLERQKLEYERALLGDVDHIKERTTQVGKYVAIGAALLGGVWLVSKVLGGRDDDEETENRRRRKKLKTKKGKSSRRKAQLVAHSDDYHFGSGISPRAQLAPPVYHATAASDADPFPAFDTTEPYSASVPAVASGYQSQYRGGYRPQPEPEQGSMVWDTLRALAASDTGKMLIGQVSGVLIAMLTRKVNEWMEMNKNSDLAASATEPETKDIDFVIHHDDAHAPEPTA
ncbi:hypothetical protein [Solirubrum puertoriconensis]|uniref:Uncharacterized protein n=1 Tax=Solirubrum puertoriconensis TaxID=1751427 RepID=A0A9X0HHJ6_SOLP1|nr:hypothetical protein [Solirubrum puertoriconensis]KUG06016.1 hypothetical protein ASU33_01180 [Solirubrum puertoriconensis]